MSAENLESYIKSAREKGVPDDRIREILTKNGWQLADINRFLVKNGVEEVAIPVPPAPHIGMWVGFLYVILFISLYVSATALSGILHFAVDEIFPDSLDQVNYGYVVNQYLMQFYLAALIVAYPIFAVLFLFLKRQAIKKPEVKNLRIRKILIYITLVGTFLIMLGHLISTVYGLLGGGTTDRSIAHFSVTFIVAGIIFAFFIFDVWGDRKGV